jgi:hypothetical protein
LCHTTVTLTLAVAPHQIKIGRHTLKGTGADADKLSPAEIAELKEVRFNATTGKKEGGEYYATWTVRKRFRSPEVIARKLKAVKLKFTLKDDTRAREKGKQHRRTMTPAVASALDRLAANAVHLYDVGDPYVLPLACYSTVR